MSMTTVDRRAGLRTEWDVPVEMDDGVTLRADVYRPLDDDPRPVLMTYGPYGKLLEFQTGYPDQWDRLVEAHPEVERDSTGAYQNWEVVDPERWVPEGYVVVRVDSRGAGRSPGVLDVWSAREAEDFAACIEWAAGQPWSTGKVGLNGISYYAMNQWQVASLQPEGLAAICAWEGAADFYRDLAYHGGIYCTFAENWYDMQVRTVQHGVGERGFRSGMNGDLVAGPETLPPEVLGDRRADLAADYRDAPLATDDYWTERAPDWDRVEVPVLSSANWGGQGLHPRGNFEAFLRAASDQTWLEVHGGEHWAEFYTDYGVDLQRRFFGHFLKGEDTGWEDQPRVLLQVRHPGERFVERAETDWPLPRTDWTRYHLDATDASLSTAAPETAGSVTYDGLGDGVTFVGAPLDAPTELTGPLAATLFVSSSTTDADLFVVVRVLGPDAGEVTFMGALDPHTPVAQGWLRASHRRLDPERSEPWQPYHPHDEVQPLEPGEVYELAVEVWPTSIVAPAGSRLAVSVRGTDYEYPGDPDAGLASMKEAFTGVGPFRHDDAATRPPETFGGEVTVHTGPEHPSHLLAPVIPERDG